MVLHSRLKTHTNRSKRYPAATYTLKPIGVPYLPHHFQSEIYKKNIVYAMPFVFILTTSPIFALFLWQFLS